MGKAQQALVQGFMAKARAKVAAANDLLNKGHWDDSVSRAYYAAYHAAQAALLTEGQRGHAPRHGRVVWLAIRQDGKLDHKWGRFLVNLKDDREAGDYEAISYLDEETARDAVTEAEEFVAEIERYLSSVLGK